MRGLKRGYAWLLLMLVTGSWINAGCAGSAAGCSDDIDCPGEQVCREGSCVYPVNDGGDAGPATDGEDAGPGDSGADAAGDAGDPGGEAADGDAANCYQGLPDPEPISCAAGIHPCLYFSESELAWIRCRMRESEINRLGFRASDALAGQIGELATGRFDKDGFVFEGDYNCTNPDVGVFHFRYEMGPGIPPAMPPTQKQILGDGRTCEICCPWTQMSFTITERLNRLITMFALTRDDACRDEAVFIMNNLAAWDEWYDPNYDPTIITSNFSRAVSYGLDVFYNLLPDGKRNAIQEAVITKGLAPSYAYLKRWVLDDFLTTGKIHYKNLYTFLLNGILISAITVSGHVSSPVEYHNGDDYSGQETVANIIDQSARYAKTLIDWLPRGAVSGYGHYEGPLYGCVSFEHLTKSAVVLDRFDPTAYKGWLDAAYFRDGFDYITYLTKDYDNAPINDASRRSSWDWKSDLLVHVTRQQNRMFTWYLDYRGIDSTYLSWFDLLFWDDSAIPDTFSSPDPPSKAFWNTGTVVFRAGWDWRDPLLVFSAGFPKPDGVATGHKQYDDNSIVLRGKYNWLLSDAGYNQNDTEKHNTVLVAGAGQDDRFGGRLKEAFFSEASPGIEFAIGDASGSYSSLNAFDRQLLFIKPDYFVVYDSIQTTDNNDSLTSIFGTGGRIVGVGWGGLKNNVPEADCGDVGCLDADRFPLVTIAKGLADIGSSYGENHDKLECAFFSSADMTPVVTKLPLVNVTQPKGDGVLYQLRLEWPAIGGQLKNLSVLVPSNDEQDVHITQVDTYQSKLDQLQIESSTTHDYLWSYLGWEAGWDQNYDAFGGETWACRGALCLVGFNRYDNRLNKIVSLDATEIFTDSGNYSIHTEPGKKMDIYLYSIGGAFEGVVRCDQDSTIWIKMPGIRRVEVGGQGHDSDQGGVQFGVSAGRTIFKVFFLPGGERAEICNNHDDDGDGATDEGCDRDGDSWYNPQMACEGYYLAGNGVVYPCRHDWYDFDDNDPLNKHDYHHAEICNARDDDRDGETDEGCDDDADSFYDRDMICDDYYIDRKFVSTYRCLCIWSDCDDGDQDLKHPCQSTDPGYASCSDICTCRDDPAP